MSATVLTVQHTPDCPPARVGGWLAAAGCRLDVRRGYAGDPLPADLTGYDGLLVLGGDMGAYDDAAYAWLAPTRELLSDAVRRDLPTLAICLGMQLLAVAEGGSVARSATGPQLGVQPVRLSPAAAEDPLFAAVEPTAVAAHWNNDLVVSAPDGAVALASTPAGLQAFRLGRRVWAVQFHPEVSVPILRRWAEADVTAGLLSAEVVEERLAAVAAADDALVRTWRRMGVGFGRLVTGPA